MEHHLCFSTVIWCYNGSKCYNGFSLYLHLKSFCTIALLHILSCKDSCPLVGLLYQGRTKFPPLIRKSHPTCLLLLLPIFNKVFSTGTFPLQWLSSLVLSFPKPGKSPAHEKNFRPISLTSCVGKLLEKILNTRLAMVFESSGVLPAHQFGFLLMHGTHDALNRFVSGVAGARNAKQEVVCFL